MIGGRPIHFGGPQCFDAILILAALILARRYHRRARRRVWLLLCAVPVALLLVSTPSILWDDRLVTLQSKLEVLWSTGMLGLFVGMACFLVSQLFPGSSGFSRVRAALALVVLCGSMLLYVRTEHWHRPFHGGLNWRAPRGLCSFGLAFREGGGPSHPGGAHVGIGWRLGEPDPDLNYMRIGNGTFEGRGAQLRAGGVAVSYLHSTKRGDDWYASPSFSFVIPFWLLIGTSGLFFLKYAGLLPRLLPQGGFSMPARVTMAAILAAFALMNLFPTSTHNHGIVRNYGFPLRHRHIAVEDGVELKIFMGDDTLGWRQDQLMMNVLVVIVVTVGAGICCEKLCGMLYASSMSRPDRHHSVAATLLRPPRPRGCVPRSRAPTRDRTGGES